MNRLERSVMQIIAPILLFVFTAGGCSGIAPYESDSLVPASSPEDDLIAGDYWVSRDRIEVILSVPTREQTRYFNNDSDRACYTFELRGAWQPAGKAGALHSKLDQAFVGVLLVSADELQDAEGEDLLSKAANFFEDFTSRMLRTSPDRSEVEAFQSSYSRAIKWKASWTVDRAGKKEEVNIKKIYAEISPGWVAQITAAATKICDDDLAREILDTLQITADPECFWPLIEQYVPGLRQQNK